MTDDVPVGARLGSERLYDVDADGWPRPFESALRYATAVADTLPDAPEEPLTEPDEPPIRPEEIPDYIPDAPERHPPIGLRNHRPARKAVKPKRRKRARKQANWREILSTLLELCGIAALTTGSWMIRAWLGVLVLGTCLVLMGIALSFEPGGRTRE